MDAHTWAFIGVLVLIGALAVVDLLTNLRINGINGTLRQIAEVLYKLRSEATYEARGRGHPPGSRGAEGGESNQNDLPPSYGEVGGAG